MPEIALVGHWQQKKLHIHVHRVFVFLAIRYFVVNALLLEVLKTKAEFRKSFAEEALEFFPFYLHFISALSKRKESLTNSSFSKQGFDTNQICLTILRHCHRYLFFWIKNNGKYEIDIFINPWQALLYESLNVFFQLFY